MSPEGSVLTEALNYLQGYTSTSFIERESSDSTLVKSLFPFPKINTNYFQSVARCCTNLLS
jgi:hypothetical protein